MVGTGDPLWTSPLAIELLKTKVETFEQSDGSLASSHRDNLGSGESMDFEFLNTSSFSESAATAENMNRQPK